MKCKRCGAPATGRVVWAGGRAFVPTCKAHVLATIAELKRKNGAAAEVVGVRPIKDAPRKPSAEPAAKASRRSSSTSSASAQGRRRRPPPPGRERLGFLWD